MVYHIEQMPDNIPYDVEDRVDKHFQQLQHAHECRTVRATDDGPEVFDDEEN